MPFVKGKTGNPNGRPKNGIKNKRKKFSKLRVVVQRLGEEAGKALDYAIGVYKDENNSTAQRYQAAKFVVEKYVDLHYQVSKEEKELNAPPKVEGEVNDSLEDTRDMSAPVVPLFPWQGGHTNTKDNE